LTVWVQTACHVNAGCLATGLKISIWCTRSPQGPGDVTQTTLTDTGVSVNVMSV